MHRIHVAATIVGIVATGVACLAARSALRVEAPGLHDPATTPSYVPRASARPSEPLQPLPTPQGLLPARVELGRRLFHEPRLSRDGSVSCASCHDLSRGGTDRLPRSRGIGGAEGDLNAPTVLNSGLNLAQFWDGRAATLEEQVDGPLLSPKEMGSTWPAALGALAADGTYVSAFRHAYREGITPDTVRDAIAAFERSLLTPSPFDDYLLGSDGALTPDQARGYALFKDLGCASCHQGANVGGNMYQTLGKVRDYYADDQGRPADQGRYNVTRLERDRHRFKVPSLRNVALTAPYLHDGSAQRLEDAVAVMATYQLGIELSGEEERLLVAFLGSLSGGEVN